MAALTIADEVNEAPSWARGARPQRAEAALADAEAAHAETTEARLAAERRAAALAATLELTVRLAGLAAALSGKEGD